MARPRHEHRGRLKAGDETSVGENERGNEGLEWGGGGGGGREGVGESLKRKRKW